MLAETLVYFSGRRDYQSGSDGKASGSQSLLRNAKELWHI
jgi:hypothetical protein